MKKFWFFAFGLILFLISKTEAQDKVFVIPLFAIDTTPPVACAGTLSAGGGGVIKAMVR